MSDYEPREISTCPICGEVIEYLRSPVEINCHKCARPIATLTRCARGHYICSQCHDGDVMSYVRSFVAECDLTDPVQAFAQMRAGFPFPVHGPEHHILVPAAFLLAYRNAGGAVAPQRILDALDEGAGLPGGTCGRWGACAAALGIGIAYSTILRAGPLEGPQRGAAHEVVARVLRHIAEFKAPRCCQRECLLALQMGVKLSGEYLRPALETVFSPVCAQADQNEECIRQACPFYKEQADPGA